MAFCLSAAGCSTAGDVPRQVPPQPVTRTAPVVDTLHGVRVVDTYRWLEEETAEVGAWTQAQNEYARAVLDLLPGRAAIEEQLKRLVQIGSVTAPVMRGNRYFFSRASPAQAQPVIYMREGALGSERMLVDPNAWARTEVAWFTPSEDGTMLAYGTRQPGSQLATVRLLDVELGQPQALEIRNVVEHVYWLPDGSGFIYERLADPSDPASREGRFHSLAAGSGEDPVLYRRPVKKRDRPTAGASASAAALSRDGRWLILSSGIDPSSNDLSIAPFDDYRRIGSRAARIVSAGVPGRADGTVIGDTLFIETTKKAPNGRVVAASVRHPGEAQWREVVPERPDAVIQDVTFGRDRIAVTYVREASNVIEVFDATGKPLGTVAQPGIGSATLTGEPDRTEAYLTFASFNHPPAIFRVDLEAPARPPQYWNGADLPLERGAADVRRVSYPSKDGTPVGMFLVHRKGFTPVGTAPTVLTGGAPGVTMAPVFSGPFAHWVEAGGVLAVPHVRGGDGYGDGWLRAGSRDNKQNAVDDLIAAAEWLVANRFTNPAKLALYGVVHGALAGAAAVTQRPDLFRAAVLERPLTDMLRYHRFLAAPALAAEYGTAETLEQFRWLFAYSPYHRVARGARYPAMLITAVEGDAESTALHARKLTAALQAASASDRSVRPILLRVDRPPQDPAALSAAAVRKIVDRRMFLDWTLGAR